MDKCGSEYRIFLKRRNIQKLIRMCPNESESEALRVHGSENGTIVELQSPRYGCRKRSGNLYAYRISELCLYNVSIPRCESKTLIVERVRTEHAQELEDCESKTLIVEREGTAQELEGCECRDYLQFYYGSMKTKTYCGNELMSLQLEIPATEFMAVFWTDPAENKLGFKLAVRCKPLT